MKKKLAKLLALGMSIALVFSLAACGDDVTTEESTTDEAVVGLVDGEDPSAEPATGDETATGESESQSEAPADPNAVPTNKAGIVNMFNGAVDKISSKSATYTRAVARSGGAISALGFDAIQFEADGNENGRWNYTVLSANFDQSNQPLPGDKTIFNKVDANSVSGAEAKDNGNTIEISLSLKDATVSQDEKNQGRNLGLGTGGYMYFINFEETASIIKSVVGGPKYDGTKGGFALPSHDKVTLNSATFTLTGGKLTATIDKASGKMTKASLSFTEKISGKATYIFAPVTANISGSGTINYTFG